MNPTPNDVHVDSVLTNVSLAFTQDANDYVSGKVFPTVGVEKKSDVYYIWDKGDFFRADTQLRAPGSESAGSGFRLTADDPYNCKVRALHVDLDDQTRANADTNVEQAITIGLTQDMMIRKELDWAIRYFQTGVWGTENAPANLWTAANGEPIKDLRTMMRAVRGQCGRNPNTVVFGGSAWDAFLENASVVDRFKHTVAGGVSTEEAVGRMLGGARVLVGNALQNTANEGAAASMAAILGNNVGVFYTTNAPSLMMQSAGYTFAWTGYLGANAEGMAVSTFRMAANKADRIEIEAAYDQKLVSANCGGLLTAVI